ncbi:MAG: caspase family protein [Crocinitomicaceae bacterium]|nr:caspase family protein [Crocinitomicaceae bacterium]
MLHRIFVLCLFFQFVFSFGQNAPEVVMTTGHNDQICAMSVSPDGTFLASAAVNKIIKIWDVSTTMEYRTLFGTNGVVEQLTFAPDNIHLAGISSDGELLIWNVITGELKHKFKASYSSKGVAFIDDGTKIVHVDENSNVAVTDLSNGQTRSIPDVYCMSLVVNAKDKKAYSLDQLGNLIYNDLETMSVIKTVKLFNEFNFPFTRGSISKDGELIAWGFNDDKLRIFDVNQSKFVYTSSGYNTKLIDLEFDKKESHLYLATHGGAVQIIDYKTQKLITEFNEPYLASRCVTGHPSGDILMMANLNMIRFYNKKTNTIFKDLGGKVSEILNMAYSQDGNYVAVATDQLRIQIWDLKLNKIACDIQGFFPCEFTPDGKHLIAMNYTLTMGVWDVTSGELVKQLPTDSELIQCVSVSDDGKYVAGAGFMNVIKIWDLESTKKITELKGHTAGILTLDFHPTQPLIASGGHDQTTRVWNYETKKEIQQFTDQTIVINSVKFSPDGKKLATSAWDKTIHLRNTVDWQTEKILTGHVNMISSIDYNKDGSVLVSGAGNNSVWEADNSIIFWNTSTGEKICQLKDHYGAVHKVVFDREADRVFSASADGTLKISDYKTCQTIATYIAVGGKEFMIYTPDNYYMASRNSLKGIAFRIDGKLVPFEQFDIYLNRPDIVATRIGKSPEQLIRAYNYLYKKRLKKLQMDEGNLKIDYQIPHIYNETELPLVVNQSAVTVSVKAWDDSYTIQQINVYVNDVPVFGEGGIRPESKVKSIRKEIEIPLITGVNKIQISCINSNGAESMYDAVEIIRENSGQKNNLYVVAIGVSNYKDARFNLTYPTKDAQDIVTKLNQTSSMYNQVYTRLLLDEQVTLSGFRELESFFSNCTYEDVAIIFIAGHGVLNVDFDYFYATYDMNFDAPEISGLSYDTIHELLGKIKAFKKLLIMDTCHSGELDKDEIERGPEPDVESGGVEFRAAGVGVRNKEGFGFENSLELMQDLFSSTQKGSGATVISSAGGAEYAMESDLWKNGLFTYVLINGLTDLAADANKDGNITVSEIRHFVNTGVKELSKGKQIPSSREENISLDYIIFGK